MPKLVGCGGSMVIGSEPQCRHQVFDIPEVRYSLIELSSLPAPAVKDVTDLLNKRFEATGKWD